MATLSVGEFWQRNRLPTGADIWDLRGAAHSIPLDLWAFVGDGKAGAGGILTIADIITGSTFAEPASGGTDILRAVAAGGSLFAAVGDNGEIVESSDGVTWSLKQTLAGNPGLFGVEYGRVDPGSPINTFVVVSRNSGIYYRNASANYVQTDSQVENWSSLAIKGTTWIAVGGTLTTVGRYTKSADGVSWNAAKNQGTKRLEAIDASASFFMAAGEAGQIWRTVDGSVWADKSIFGVLGSIWAIRSLGGSNWICAADDKIYRSTDDGDNWTRVDPSISTKDGLALAVDSPTATEAALCTEDGEIWSSYDQTQEDHTPVDPPETSQSLTENTEFAGDTVGKLVSQFRSGT